MSQNFFRTRRKLQNMTAGMKPKDKDLFPESNEIIEVKEREDYRGDKQTHSKGQTHPGNVNNLERTRRDETEEHEHRTWYQELRPGCRMPEEKPFA
jgi:hypothetical protein